MTLETPFRLMWTDEEGDNVCFSTDEELAQALKFVKGQENQLFKVIIKTPQVQQEQAQAARKSAFQGHYQDSSGSTRTGSSCKKISFSRSLSRLLRFNKNRLK